MQVGPSYCPCFGENRRLEFLATLAMGGAQDGSSVAHRLSPVKNELFLQVERRRGYPVLEATPSLPALRVVGECRQRAPLDRLWWPLVFGQNDLWV